MEKNKTEVRIEKGELVIERNNKTHRFELKKISERLATATTEQLKEFTVSPSGYGIHWNQLDEDISIAALVNEPAESYGKNSSDS
jgi:hypothetical protein